MKLKNIRVTVYLIYDLSGKKDGYIGQTTKPWEKYCDDYVDTARKRDLSTKSGWRDESDRARAIRKRKFRVGRKILKTGSLSIWNIEEIRLIALYKKRGWELWNMNSGGQGMANPTEATREKLRYPKSLEHRIKIGNVHRGKIVSVETKKKQSEARLEWCKTHDGPTSGRIMPEHEKVKHSSSLNKYYAHQENRDKKSDEMRKWSKEHPGRKGTPWSTKTRLAHEWHKGKNQWN